MEKVIYRKLGDFCTIEKGKTPIQKAIPGEYPLVVTAPTRKSSNEYQFDKPSICIPLVSSRGHGVAAINHVYYQEGKFALGNILCAVTPNNNSLIIPKYLYYYLEYAKDDILVPLMRGAANVAMHVVDLYDVVIPIPPIAFQQKVIETCDVFNAFLSEIDKEKELRTKQFSVVQNELFDFKG